jgi:hypothetical protein
VQVPEVPVPIGELAEEEGAAVAEPGRVAAELVPGVRLGHRRGGLGKLRADQEAHAHGRAQEGGVQTELGGQGLVEDEQASVGEVAGPPANRHLGQLAGEPVLQRQGDGRCGVHPNQGTCGPADAVSSW